MDKEIFRRKLCLGARKLFSHQTCSKANFYACICAFAIFHEAIAIHIAKAHNNNSLPRCIITYNIVIPLYVKET